MGKRDHSLAGEETGRAEGEDRTSPIRLPSLLHHRVSVSSFLSLRTFANTTDLSIKNTRERLLSPIYRWERRVREEGKGKGILAKLRHVFNN